MGTPFTKQNLVADGMYVMYAPSGSAYAKDAKFVARFKYGRASRNPFMTCLRRNFTVEEYFARMEAGESPLPIAESKGFVLSHIKRWLKLDGYPQTVAGYKTWSADRAAAREAARA
jgi:hypothetical protein